MAKLSRPKRLVRALHKLKGLIAERNGADRHKTHFATSGISRFTREELLEAQFSVMWAIYREHYTPMKSFGDALKPKEEL